MREETRVRNSTGYNPGADPAFLMGGGGGVQNIKGTITIMKTFFW